MFVSFSVFQYRREVERAKRKKKLFSPRAVNGKAFLSTRKTFFLLSTFFFYLFHISLSLSEQGRSIFPKKINQIGIAHFVFIFERGIRNMIMDL